MAYKMPFDVESTLLCYNDSSTTVVLEYLLYTFMCVLSIVYTSIIRMTVRIVSQLCTRVKVQ
jgi:hypothetical protein